jgi:crotonobetainyl-CoA:carnitine CoA-transferase CaiB-like acyl-CoA transferase
MGTEAGLHGVRVLDLAQGPGRFATKLLAELGADVVKVAGAGARGPAMRDPELDARGGLADWMYDGGKRTVSLDLNLDLDLDSRSSVEGDAAASALRRLAEHADLVIDDWVPGRLGALGLDHARLATANPSLVAVSLTPFGQSGPRAGWHGSDLVAAALGGVSSLTGPAGKPLNSWGRQNEHFGGFVTAICALAGLHDARRTGRGHAVDVSLHEVVTGSIENLFFQYLYHDVLDDLPALAPRQGALHWLGVYDVVPARTGTVMVTPTPSPSPLIDWMVEEGFEEAIEYAGLGIEEILARRADLMATIRRFCLEHDAGYLFREGQSRRVAFGEVQSVPQVVGNPQFAHRGFLRSVDWDGPPVRTAGWPAQRTGTPAPPPRPPAAGPTPVEDVVAGWAAAPRPVAPGDAASSVVASGKPLEGVRIADFTWVLAGPFCTRLLGDLGADVIKVQNVERATLVNRSNYPYYAVWNRSKRSALLDMKHPGALAVARRLVEASDVLVENYSAGVLARWGLDWDTVHAWNPRLIYVTMSGCGHDGPWSNVLSYAPTVHALCGLTYLTNPADRRDVGCGFSLNDHAAGFVAATEILAALEARRRTGLGQRIDLAQLEVGSWLITPAILDLLANGRVTEPDGNADPFAVHAPNDTYRCGDDRWVAVSVDDDAWPRLCALAGRADLVADDALRRAVGRLARRDELDRLVGDWCAARSAAAAMEQLQAAGVAAGVVQDAADLLDDPQHRDRGFWRRFDEHPLFGPRPYDRFPARWSTTDLEPYRRAPVFGEHNDEVWGELCGLDPAEVADGVADGLFS